MEFFIEPTITKEYLLSKNSQETYLNYYLGIPVKKGLFRSPLREDNKPTCAFYRNKRGDIIFKDFSGQFYGNFIDVVKYKYGCDYHKALRIIANDFGYIHSKTLEKCEKKIEIAKEKFTESTGAIIQVQIKDYTPAELKWWSQFGVSEDTLKKFRVFSCETVFLNGNIFTKSTNSRFIFGYYRGKNKDGVELWRIYLPQHRSREPKFLSNWKSNMIQGLSQLPKTGDYLVITKSLKDCATLYEFGVPAIAPNSETIFLSEAQLTALQKRFKCILVMYDNDLPGIQNMNKFRKQFDLRAVWIPRKYGVKDISDFYKKYGREKTLQLINETKEKFK